MKPNSPAPPAAEGRVDHHQAESAQQVVDDEQPPRVGAVGQPARADRADDVEDADQREEAGGGRRGDVVVVGGRHEVGLDETVGRQAADEEAAEQQPERAAVPGVAERTERGRTGRMSRSAARRRSASVAPYGSRPMSSGRSRRNSTTTGTTARAPMAIVTPTHRQPTPSASRDSTGRKTSWPLAVAAVRAPVTRPRRATNQRLATVGREDRRHAPGSDADDDTPQQEQLPRLGHARRAESAERDDDERRPRSPCAARSGPAARRRTDR